MTKEQKKKNIEENESTFQAALKGWSENGNKKDYDTIWFCIYKACLNMCKSKANGIVIPALEEKALDATIKCIEAINRGTRPEKLSSWVYLYCIGRLYDRKTQRVEREQPFEFYTNNFFQTEEGDIEKYE